MTVNTRKLFTTIKEYNRLGEIIVSQANWAIAASYSCYQTSQ